MLLSLHVQVRMQAASTAAQAQVVAATTGASAAGPEKAAPSSGVRRYPNARAAYGLIARCEAELSGRFFTARRW